MRWLAAFLASWLLAQPALADQDLVRRLHQEEREHGLPHNSLVALSLTESDLSWYALNIDGASFYPRSKSEALQILQNVGTRPYVVRIKRAAKQKSELYFYRTLHAAKRAARKLKSTPGYPKAIPFDEAEGLPYRKLDMLNTGLCALQINYRWHGNREGRTVDKILDREFCIEYGAQFLASLIDKHGFERGVGCYYTCGNNDYQRKARAEYFQRYTRHFSRLNASTDIAQR